MSIRVMTWVWSQSRSKKNARLLLLAIADCAADDGCNAYPSVAELVRKTGLSERAVQSTLADLVKLGELRIDRNAGPGGCNRYQVVMTPAESAPPQILHPPQISHPADPAPPADSAGAEAAPLPQNLHPTPARSAPGTVLEPKISSSKRSSRPKKTIDPAEESTGQRVNRLARIYTDRVKLSNFNAVAGVVRKAVNANVSDDLITAGLNHLAEDQRAVTVDSLRYAIYGIPPSQYRPAAAKTSTTDQRVNDALALAERLEQKELPQ